MSLTDWLKRLRKPEAVPAAPVRPAETPVSAEPQAVAAAAAEPDAPPERRRKQRTNAPVGTRVLIVDDSATIVALLRRMMLQNEYDVMEADTAELAMEKISEMTPELIFLDIVLPGMSGFEALRKLRRDPATKAIPVIMISGNEQATEQFYVQRIGADDFMKKPFSRAEVFSRIEKLIDAGRLPRRAEPLREPDPAPLPVVAPVTEWTLEPVAGTPAPTGAGTAEAHIPDWSLEPIQREPEPESVPGLHAALAAGDVSEGSGKADAVAAAAASGETPQDRDMSGDPQQRS
jgi:twitching motility two-component system response regulator PilH